MAPRELNATPTSPLLSFRSLVGDPFNLVDRAVVPAVTTLTIRVDRGQPRFLLHWRDPAKVATAGGMYDAIPAGEFQPSSLAGWDRANDFDLWRNIVRELSEELLGAPEHDGSRGEPIDYDRWPLYRALQGARADGRLSAVCLGVGVDALTVAATILTVIVIDGRVFDDIFHDVVQVNAEGLTITSHDPTRIATGIPLTHHTVTKLLSSGPLASPGAACLHLAWIHRKELLDERADTADTLVSMAIDPEGQPGRFSRTPAATPPRRRGPGGWPGWAWGLVGGGGVLALLLVGFTVLVVAVAATTDPEEAGSAGQPTPSASPSSEPEPTAEPAVVLTAELVDFEPGLLYEGGDYTSVRVTIRNNGDEQISVNPVEFWAVDTDGVKSGVDLTASLELLKPVDLLPGETASGVVTFEGALDLAYVTFEPLLGGEGARADL